MRGTEIKINIVLGELIEMMYSDIELKRTENFVNSYSEMVTLTTENIKKYFSEFQKKFDQISISQEKVFYFGNKLYSEKELLRYINNIHKQQVKKNREKLMKRYFK